MKGVTNKFVMISIELQNETLLLIHLEKFYHTPATYTHYLSMRGQNGPTVAFPPKELVAWQAQEHYSMHINL